MSAVLEKAFASVYPASKAQADAADRVQSTLFPVAPPVSRGFKRNPHLCYADITSRLLGGEIRIGYEWDGEPEDRIAPLAILNEVWAGPLDLGIHLDMSSSSILEYELRRYLIKNPGRLV